MVVSKKNSLLPPSREVPPFTLGVVVQTRPTGSLAVTLGALAESVRRATAGEGGAVSTYSTAGEGGRGIGRIDAHSLTQPMRFCPGEEASAQTQSII